MVNDRKTEFNEQCLQIILYYSQVTHGSLPIVQKTFNAKSRQTVFLLPPLITSGFNEFLHTVSRKSLRTRLTNDKYFKQYRNFERFRNNNLFINPPQPQFCVLFILICKQGNSNRYR